MSVLHLTVGQLKDVAKRLEWTPEEIKNGHLWLAKAKLIRDEFGLSDDDILRGDWDFYRDQK